MLLEDGDIVLVRDGESCGAFVVKSQTLQPEQMEYDWYYRSDGNGMVFVKDPAVSSGSELSGSSTSSLNMHFGSFDLQWSGGDRGFGWFYYPDGPGVEFCVTRARQLQNIDAMSERWQFKSVNDKPTAVPSTRLKLESHDGN